MRLPNAYGSVIKLSGKRRRPYAVRITTGLKNVGTDEHPQARQVYKYLGYFEKRAEAMKYLADYNAGIEVKEHRSVKDIPTFAQVYEMWLQEKEDMGGLSSSLQRSYSAAYAHLHKIHERKVASLRHADVQPIITANRDKSKSSVRNMILVCRGVSSYAMKNEFITVDFSAHLKAVYQAEKSIHTIFTHDEIEALWKHKNTEAAQFALITIYTGMRPSEAMSLKVTEEDIRRGYATIKGSKTEAGKNRVIPFHKDIRPVVADWSKIKHGPAYTFRQRAWNPLMCDLSMKHLPHDGRHTCATLMEEAGIPLNRRKLILGHTLKDITEGVYTHVSPEILVEEIAKITP